MIRNISEIWKNCSLRIKFLASFFIVLFVISLFNLYLNNNNYKITDKFNNTIINYHKINYLQELVEQNGNELYSYLNTGEIANKYKYESTKREIIKILEPLYSEYSSVEIYFRLKAINNSTESYFEYFDQAIEDKENNKGKYYEKYYYGIDIQQYTIIYIQELLNLSLNEGTILYNELAQKAELTRHISVTLIIVMFILAMFMGVLFANYLINPIKQLAKASMKIATGDLEGEDVSIESKDEIGVLAASFNIMSTNIRKYVKDLEEKVEIEKKLHEEELELIHMEKLVEEARYDALQSQINPHFLFNTLNTISRTAMFENAHKSMKLIKALSNLFRYRLRQNKSMVPLSEELKIIGEYIYLQKVRFGDRIKYVESISEDCKNIMVPILLFQPIIENSIVHGIEPKIEGGIVRIKAKIKKSNDNKEIVVIRITDTGVGMTKQQLQKLREFSIEDRKSIGVSNVYHRFMIASDHQGMFLIKSKVGKGTIVEFRFEKEEFNVQI